jgi:antitoxin component of RelBE/YafQ-DinJ toxin-antitoxin module
MSLSTAFNIFLRQSVREQQIPLVVTKNVPNAVTLAAMDAAEKITQSREPKSRVLGILKFYLITRVSEHLFFAMPEVSR